MRLRIGTGYLGTDEIKVSASMENIIPSPPPEWSIKYNFYKFSFINYQDCQVIINNGNPIYLGAERGFECTHIDAPIYSFVIVQPNIQYEFIGAY